MDTTMWRLIVSLVLFSFVASAMSGAVHGGHDDSHGVFHSVENVNDEGPVSDGSDDHASHHANDATGGVIAGDHMKVEFEHCVSRGEGQAEEMAIELKRQCIARKIHCHLHHCEKLEKLTDECIIYYRAAHVLCFYRDYCKRENFTDCIVSHSYDELNSSHIFLVHDRDFSVALGGYSSFVHHIDEKPVHKVREQGIHVATLHSLQTKYEAELKKKECDEHGDDCPAPEKINVMDLPSCFFVYRNEDMENLRGQHEEHDSCNYLKK